MTSTLQTMAMSPWIPQPVDRPPIFTVYRTQGGIELHSGCEPIEQSRLISAYKLYQDAREFAEILSLETVLPLFDCIDRLTED